ncbi:MAG: hypothetical protein NDI63_09770 [Pseudobdellovibrio sp.]|nr:hypothetical protein [Pseudobdellovibrio sp.]
MNQDPLAKNKTTETQKIARWVGMVSQIDFYFPFFVFFYGLVLTFVLEIPFFLKLAQEKMPEYHAQFERHRQLAVISLYVGGLWSLQNLWFS